MIRHAVMWAVFLLAASWVIKNPAAAGHAVHHWIDAAMTFAGNL